jgi:hypothetical protein
MIEKKHIHLVYNIFVCIFIIIASLTPVDTATNIQKQSYKNDTQEISQLPMTKKDNLQQDINLRPCLRSTTIYVDQNPGRDCIGSYDVINRSYVEYITGCTSYDTLQEAVNNIQTGDTILVRGDVYQPTQKISLFLSGYEGNPITLRNYPGEQPIIYSQATTGHVFQFYASYWIIDGFEITNFVNGGILNHWDLHYGIILKNLSIHSPNMQIPANNGFRKNGIDLYQAIGTRIENVTIHGLGMNNGISIWDGSENVTLQSVTIHDVSGDGIATTPNGNVQGLFIRDSIVYNNGDAGFDLTVNGGAGIRLEDCLSYGNRNGLKCWSGPHIVRGITAFRNTENGIQLSVRGPGQQTLYTPGELYLGAATLIRNKIDLWVGTSNSSYTSTVYGENIIAAYPDIHSENIHCTLMTINGCHFVDAGHNIFYREPTLSPTNRLIQLNGIDYSAYQMNTQSIPGFQATTCSVDPCFLAIDEYPNLFSDMILYDFHLQENSPAVNTGAIINGYHCLFADDDPLHPMDPSAPEKHWYGSAPDIGVCEFQPIHINHAPDIPIVSGSKKQIIGQINVFTITGTDPDLDNVFYMLKWDDELSEWYGPFASGHELVLTHSWSLPVLHTVYVKSKDIFNFESNWSEPFEITVYRLGDVNGDGRVNYDDIDGFVLAISGGEQAYNQAYPLGYFYTADCNQDGMVNFDDIDAFVQLVAPG